MRMLAKLKFENVLVNGERKAKLVGFENVLEQKDLPLNYLRYNPAFFRENDNLMTRTQNSGTWIRTGIGTVCTEEELTYLIGQMKQAGKRLTEINKRAKDKAWEGKTFEVEI